MVQITKALATGVLAYFASSAVAHPGHDLRAEVAQRSEFLKKARSLDGCSAKLKARGHEARSVARRERVLNGLRRKRGINANKPRDLASVLATDHESNLTGITLSTDPSVLFQSSSSCILGPDVTQGPYYVSGELVRENIAEDQEGVPLYVDIQLVDYTTCEPVSDVYIDFWHCNATGVYSGIVANGNGDSSDESNLDKTFLRGIQKTDASGVAQFATIFPGHYTSRATHIHVLAHPANETTLLPNNTISGLSSSYVGQLFYDQDLITAVELNEPYANNTQTLTTNAEDSILSEEAGTIDPFAQYVYLSDDITDGIFSWISLGFDPTEDNSVTPAATYTGNGGVENESSGMGGGSGIPSGAVPSGTPPTKH